MNDLSPPKQWGPWRAQAWTSRPGG